MTRHPRLIALVAVALVLTGVVLGAGRDAPPAPPTSATGGSAAAEPQPAEALPAPDAPIPREPQTLAATLASTSATLDVAIDRWRVEGDPSRGGPPREVALLAHHQQRIYRLLTDRRALSRAVLAHLSRPLRAEARDNVLARRELGLITSVRRGPPPKVRVGPAEPADVLRRHYRAAWRRFGVRPAVLAAVNFVESAFGRLRNRSISGARGPMQFMPATWRAYGLGGDIHDPRDAILGAANYLHASGAPRDERRALYHYNPSHRYVSAISRYARRIRADPRAFYAYYAWQVYAGGRRLTEPPD
jgi:membrane-bound lytic murein transglycosylase B